MLSAVVSNLLKAQWSDMAAIVASVFGLLVGSVVVFDVGGAATRLATHEYQHQQVGREFGPTRTLIRRVYLMFVVIELISTSVH
jgi:purine-cytosine permease-like protein